MKRLRADYAHAGMESLFVSLQPWLTGDCECGFASLGAALGKSEGTPVYWSTDYASAFGT
jgi:hypothetical protein